MNAIQMDDKMKDDVTEPDISVTGSDEPAVVDKSDVVKPVVVSKPTKSFLSRRQFFLLSILKTYRLVPPCICH